MDQEKRVVKTVTGPKAAIATFIRPSDKVRIYVFARRGEGDANAIKRVMSRNGAGGQPYDMCK